MPGSEPSQHCATWASLPLAYRLQSHLPVLMRRRCACWWRRTSAPTLRSSTSHLVLGRSTAHSAAFKTIMHSLCCRAASFSSSLPPSPPLSLHGPAPAHSRTPPHSVNPHTAAFRAISCTHNPCRRAASFSSSSPPAPPLSLPHPAPAHARTPRPSANSCPFTQRRARQSCTIRGAGRHPSRARLLPFPRPSTALHVLHSRTPRPVANPYPLTQRRSG